MPVFFVFIVNERIYPYGAAPRYTVKKRKKKYSKPTRTLSPIKAQTVIREARMLTEPVCASEGMELIHLEYQRESAGWIMRLYIDKPGGVTLDDCAIISRQMNDLLDVHLEDIGPYNLEVTSPGPDRPLGKVQDYERFKGNLVKIRTNIAYNGQKNFTGVLMGLSGDQVDLQMDDETVRISLKDISKARLTNFSGES
jgi:ribosome maturation factor RimP